MRALLLFSLVLTCQSPRVRGHVSLTYPPARGVNLDFLDNTRTHPPCGMPKGEARASLAPGSVLNVTWHLGYPHRGGFKLELQDEEDQFIELLTPAEGGSKKDGFMDDDPTQQSFLVTLPQKECIHCSIRLVRQASEWSGKYIFWSCADINISSKIDRGVCGVNGLLKDGICECNKGFYGKECEYREECASHQDCGGPLRGECILPEGTTLPRMRRICYCHIGYFGAHCEKDSPLTAKLTSMDGYRSKKLNDVMTLFWRKMEGENQIEMVIRGSTKSFVAVGWRSLNTTKQCKKAFTGLEQFHASGTDQPSSGESAEDDASVDKYVPRGDFNGMDCTDIVVGWARGDLGRVVDSYTRDRSTPLPDQDYGGEEDLTAALAYEENQDTVVVFRKPLEAHHATDNSIEKDSMHVIWAHGQMKGSFSHSPPSGLEVGSPREPDFYKEDELKYHGRNNRGITTINFLQVD